MVAISPCIVIIVQFPCNLIRISDILAI